MSPAMQKTYTVVITLDESDGGFVGVCDELGAFSQGGTYGEVMENVKEAVELAAEEAGNSGGFNMLIVQRRDARDFRSFRQCDDKTP